MLGRPRIRAQNGHFLYRKGQIYGGGLVLFAEESDVDAQLLEQMANL